MNEDQPYNPANDANQGVVQLMAQSDESTAGVPQDKRMSPVTASGPEPEKAEVNDSDGDTGINNDLLAEEETEDGDVEMTNGEEE